MYKTKFNIININLKKNDFTEILKNLFMNNINKTINYNNSEFEDFLWYKKYCIEIQIKSGYTKLSFTGGDGFLSQNIKFFELAIVSQMKNTNLIINIYSEHTITYKFIKFLGKIIKFCNSEYCFIHLIEKDKIKDFEEFYVHIQALPCCIYFNFLLIEDRGLERYKIEYISNMETYKVITYNEDKIISEINFNNIIDDVAME